ncbi:LPS O-antigen chain length determinant protein WzzB [Kosakonia sacchari]|uniref:LPS O-antigen chain length determinant protein WzzB n=1 Tax=Kosakonia sacchari TaxID=1158459 RepID=UPI002ACE0B97|nr:LPS O-antigen chain length determinant protein WzzB [Kosakonia sacchari]MDZ7320190.1 LPS O-antigen chain length determinant protein WzzB [Kosakonia sacchari]
MTNDKGYGVEQNRDSQEQIDIFELFFHLWRGKWLIAACIACAIVAASVYLTKAKEKWTSDAIISAPDAGQIAAYANSMVILSEPSRLTINDIQERVIRRFNSAFSALATTLQNKGEPEYLTIDSSVAGQPFPLKLTYQGSVAKDTQQRLAQYIQQVDQQVARELNDDLKVNIKFKIQTLAESLATQEKIAQEQKTLRLKQISQALTVAQEAKIQAPQIQQVENVSQDTLFLLGSDALESMIKNEETRPLVFGEEYYKTRKNMLQIQAVNAEARDVHAYRYVMKPSLPFRRDSPNYTLTILLATVLGAIIGSGIVLMRVAIKNHH